jgi:hypothetical protein
MIPKILKYTFVIFLVIVIPRNSFAAVCSINPGQSTCTFGEGDWRNPEYNENCWKKGGTKVPKTRTNGNIDLYCLPKYHLQDLPSPAGGSKTLITDDFKAGFLFACKSGTTTNMSSFVTNVQQYSDTSVFPLNLLSGAMVDRYEFLTIKYDAALRANCGYCDDVNTCMSYGTGGGSTTDVSCEIDTTDVTGRCTFGTGALRCYIPGSANVTARGSSGGVAYNLFCPPEAVDGFQVRCPTSVTNYENVFEYIGSPPVLSNMLRTGTGCTVGSLSTCVINPDGSSCQYLDSCISTNYKVGKTGSTNKTLYCGGSYAYATNTRVFECDVPPSTSFSYAEVLDPNQGCIKYQHKDSCRFLSPTASDYCPDTSTAPICTENKYYKYRTSVYTEITDAEVTSYTNCIRANGTNESCSLSKIGVPATSIYKCTCADPGGALCTIGGIAGLPCPKICSYTQGGFNLRIQQQVKASSPLAFIKVLSDFIFWLAVLIFVINFLRAGLSYTQSKGDETKLKEASAILTSTIGGMVFILLMGGLVRYILDTLGAAGLR